MKLLSILIVLCFFFFTSSTCNKASKSKTCFKGRLEIKGICGNYTVKALEGDISALNIAPSWKDETTNKTYTNVFALGSSCKFPDLKEGDEFYFILSGGAEDCTVCMAYYPTPSQKNNIIVISACP